MRKIFLGIIILNYMLYAEISALEAAQLERKAAKIRKELGIHIPTEKEKELERIRAELHLDFDTSSKDALLGQHKATTVQSLTGSNKNDTIIDTIGSGLSEITDTLGISQDTKEESYSFTKTLNTFYTTIGLEEGESWGMPSVFGFNEKKKKHKNLFSIGILGDMQDTGHTIFKGMKYSGQSAEFSSGMVYKSAKMYNTMFGMFEDSPFNVFEEKKERSVFDLFEEGNAILDLFD